MKRPLQPPDEGARLEALRRYDLLDTPPEQALDDLTLLASHICEAPISLISLIDEQRQWFKSRVGMSVSETSRDISFCGHAILQPDLFIVPDAASDERFADNPLVTGDHHIRFYAGAPVFTPAGYALGALCVMDHVPRQLSATQQQALRVLSRQATAQLELRRQASELVRANRQQEQQNQELREAAEFSRQIIAGAREGIAVFDRDLRYRVFNPFMEELTSWRAHEVLGRTLEEVMPSPTAVAITDRLRHGLLGEVVLSGDQLINPSEVAGPRWVSSKISPLRDAGGGIAGVIAILNDITERKQAEEALREREHLLSEAQRIGHAGGWVYTIATDKVTWSDELYRIYGLQPEQFEATLQAYMSLVHPDDKAKMQSVIERALRDQEPYDVEERIIQPGGDIRILRSRGQVELNGSGKPVRLVGVCQDVTERKRAEEERLASEVRYRALFECAPDGIVIADSQSHYIDANPSICRMLGYTRDELIGLHASDIVAPTEIPHIAPALDLIKARSDYHRQWKFRRKDGSFVEAEVMAIVMPDGNLLGMIRDITDRKVAEARIQHLNRVYAVLSDINEAIVRERDRQAMLETACRIAVAKGGFLMAWIGLIDAETGQLQITAHAGAAPGALEVVKSLLEDQQGGGCSMTQHALQTGQHSACDDIAHDPRTASWREAALQRGYRAMVALPLRAGERVIGAFNLYAEEPGVFDLEELRLLDELAVDISFALEVNEREAERVHAERALLSSEERFRELAANVSEVFWMTDPLKKQVLYISPAYEKIWGRTCASVYEDPRTWLDAIHPDDRERMIQASSTRQASGDYEEIFRVIRPDGSVRWVQDRAFPVRDAGGTLVRIVGTAEDITARRQLEEQLRQAQKMEAIGQLAGGVAHDFNNILTVIHGYGALLMMPDQSPAETLEAAQEIVQASERAANLTRQLLAFSRRQVMQTRELDLNEVITSLAKMLQRILGEDVRLQLSLDPRPLMTRADAGMLDQVLMNLVVNARDAMPGGGQLVIETSQRDLSEDEARTIPGATAGRQVTVRVSDSGSGIAAEHLSHIFEPFFTTKEAGKGTGLGLATVFGIVAQHHGTVQVESKVGVGTTFQICLPAAAAADAHAQGTARPEPPGGKESILIVEDEPSVRILTRVVLERAGYRVLEAIKAADALRVWDQHQGAIDLILTDIVLPEGLNGRELATQLQARNPKLGVIFTSGYSADMAGRELTLREGENFIHKPASPQQLLEIVRQCLDGQRGRRSGEAEARISRRNRLSNPSM